MKTAQIIQAGGTWLPGISAYSISLEDIDSEDTTRSESGKMIRRRLRAKVLKLSVTHIVDMDKMVTITEKIGETTVELKVYCPARSDAVSGYVTATFYVSKITTRMIVLQDKSWWEVSYNAIEV